jgi:predicted DNA-binding ribbon-helix-helix protein
MKRTQLYLHDEIWKALHILARQQGATISELVRRAIRDKYGNSSATRREAMRAFVGMWKDRQDLPDSGTYVRRLRKGKRLRRVAS